MFGQALLIIEGEERRLGQWDYVHCPAETKHLLAVPRAARGAGGALSGLRAGLA